MRAEQQSVVVIDPGHGGAADVDGSSHNNATGPNGLLEKNLTLDLARRVERALASDAVVHLTRTGDVNVGLEARTQVGRNNDASIFLSIHFNGFNDPAVDGTEVWVHPNANQRSRTLARTVLTRLLAVTGVRDRGVREENFGVLRPERHTADCAVCLAEVAFLTNPAQARRLEGEAYRQQLADALVAAIRQHLPAAAAQELAYGGVAVRRGANGWDAPALWGELPATAAGRRAAWGDEDDDLPPPPAPAAQRAASEALGGGEAAPAAFTLTASVGDGGRNNAADVRALKERLISLGFNWLTANETMDATTMRAIRLFQSIIAGRPSVGGDGRVDVPGGTYNWLRAANAPRWQLMPAGAAAEGFVNDELADTNDQHDYGTNWLADTLRAAAAAYRTNYLSSHAGAALIAVNDASLPQGGDTGQHIGHETGLDCDMRLPRTDGRAGGITHNDRPPYDQAATRAQLQALRAQPLVSVILFNDSTLIGEGLCQQEKGHDNHYHVRVRPPAMAATPLTLGAGEAVTADALAEATIGLAGGRGSRLHPEYVRQALAGRRSNTPLTTVFEAALRGGGALADMARRVVREIERQFILDPAASSLDLLPADRRDRYRRFAWGEDDFPGGDPPGANEARADEMAADLSRVCPERRPNQGGAAVVTKAQLIAWQGLPGNNIDTFWRYVNDEMQTVPNQGAHKLNRHALPTFQQMATDAAADGVTLTILDSDRTVAASRQAAGQAGNRKAVAAFSSHNLGLAMDLAMSHGSRRYQETTTRPMQNVVDMRQSPAHKWLFLRGEGYGWYPYQNEPWHWEYNPPGFRARFFANWTGAVPGATTQAAVLQAMTVSVQYDVPLIPQPDKLSCWAGAMAMLVSYRRRATVTPAQLAESVGRSLRTSYGWDMLESVRARFGFRDIPMPENMSYVPPPADWHAWLRQYGPLWVTVRGLPSHAIIVAGIVGDLTPDGTTVRILDPWDRLHYDNDLIEFRPPNHGRRAELPYTRFAAEFMNIDVLQNIGNWRILYISPLSTGQGAWALGSGAAAVTLGYGVPGARITQAFGPRHLGIDVSLSNAHGGGADDPRRGLPVYAAIKPTLDITALNQVAVVDRNNGPRTGLGIAGSGQARLENAQVIVQRWQPTGDFDYGGLVGLACRYSYTRHDGRPSRFTVYVEFLHLITDRYLPKDGNNQLISAAAWAATGKGIGFGPRMVNNATLTAADVTGGAPLLVGYLGATQFPHVHIQAAYSDGEQGYLQDTRLSPEAILFASQNVP